MSGDIKVGYVPYSRNLQHPGDRRRLNLWAKSNASPLEIMNPLICDVLVLSNAANFNYWLSRAKVPVVLDLVDGYLGENPSLVKDFSRNLLRSFLGKSDFASITYTRAVKRACRKASAVIVASVEQSNLVRPFNQNVHVILDDHSEFRGENSDESGRVPRSDNKYIFWEGFGFTLKHFEFIAAELDEYLHENDLNLVMVTDIVFPRWGGKYGNIYTEDLIRKWFIKSADRINLVPWTVPNVLEWASKSLFAIIPIDTDDHFANLKSENKLMSMWQLGLPVIFSDTPAYRRVSSRLDLGRWCVPRDKWRETLASIKVHELISDNSKVESFISQEHAPSVLAQKWESVILSVKNEI
jgi:hypothetical protein